MSVNGEIIQFNTGDTAKTHTIFIEQDQICETDPNEFFFSNIVLDSGVQPIQVIHPQANITIDDRSEPECGKDRQLFIVTIFTIEIVVGVYHS